MDTTNGTRHRILGLLLIAVPLVAAPACAGGDPDVDPGTGGAGGDEVGSSNGSAGGMNGTGGTGGMGGSGSTTGGGGMPPGPDTTPPSVVSVVPADGAQGVTDDATITITFSEAMDKSSAQAAFQSANLGAVTFDWLDDQTMEVVPNNLSYAEGGPSVTANAYDYSVTNVAQDLAGNPLPSSFDVSFTTLREVTDFMPETFEGAVGANGTLWELSGGVMPIGRVVYGEFNQFNATPRLLVDFDISGIPVGATVELAEVDCGYVSRFGAKPPATNSFAHVSYSPNDRAAGYSAAELTSYSDPLGFGLQFFPSLRLTEDVTAPLVSQRMASATLLQFRLTVPTQAVGSTENYLNWRDDQNPNAGCGPQALSVVYLVP